MERFEIIAGSKPVPNYTDFDIVHSVPVSPSIVDPLCVDVARNSDGSVASVAFSSDIALLFNQKRLEDTLGRDGLKKFFDDMSARSPALSSLRQKISDDDLAAMCKSRYLQSASEILSWSNYLNENYQHLMDVVKSRVSTHSDGDTDGSAPADPTASTTADA
jgi:hypothetical protein